MSRKLFAFLLSELGVLRIECKGCKGIIEMRLAEAGKHGWMACPLCRASFDPNKSGTDRIAGLLAAIALAQNEKNVFDVEFVLPEE